METPKIPPKILLVDDERDLVCTMSERMGLRGMTVEVALSGAEAVARLLRERFAAVVLDVKMKGMSGLEVLRVIKESYPAVPVIMLTGHDSMQEARACMQAGAFDYLMKPIALDDLIAKIHEAVGG